VAILKNTEAYAAVCNGHDAKALAAMWSPEAVCTDPSIAEEAVGREKIEKVSANTLTELTGAKLEENMESIDFVSPNVAIETGSHSAERR
jgi:ketosteroid isomerase-like protein